MCVCVCVRVCVCACIYCRDDQVFLICICIYVYIYIYIYIYTYICVYVCVCIWRCYYLSVLSRAFSCASFSYIYMYAALSSCSLIRFHPHIFQHTFVLFLIHIYVYTYMCAHLKCRHYASFFCPRISQKACVFPRNSLQDLFWCVAGSFGERRVLRLSVSSVGFCCRNCNIFLHLCYRCACPSEASFLRDLVLCNTLQHTATHCNTLQHTATHWHCSILQHTLSREFCHCSHNSVAVCCNVYGDPT